MRRFDKESGFVLVEAIAALAVAAIAAAGLMAALGAASGRSAEARIRDLALREAQLLLAEALSTSSPADLIQQGDLPKLDLSWERNLEPADDSGLQRIVINVSWRTLRKNGTTRLEAYRIASIQ